MRKTVAHLFAMAACLFFAIPGVIAQTDTIAQDDLHKQFDEARKKDDRAKMDSCINEMRKQKDKTPQRYIDEFNYYVIKSYSCSDLQFSDVYPTMDGVTAVSEIVEDGELKGYSYYIESYNKDYADSALTAIDNGISKHRNELSMRFGKIHFLSLLKRWDDYKIAILKTLDQHKIKKNQQAKNPKKIRDWNYPGVEEPWDIVFHYTILDYESKLFEQCKLTKESRKNDEKMTGLMRDIANKMLEIYPDNVVQMNIIAVTYNAMDNPEDALTWLKKAHGTDPQDIVVLFNLLSTYNALEMKDGKTGIKKAEYDKEISKTLNEIINYCENKGDEATKAKAEKWLEELDTTEPSERHYDME